MSAFRAGSGSLRYELVENWEQLPAGWEHGDVPATATDSEGRVYVFARSAHPLTVYSRDGAFLGSWGEGEFPHPHGIYIDPQDRVFLVDDGDHTARAYTREGRRLLTLGNPSVPSNTGYSGSTDSVQNSAGPFNRPTNVVLGPGGTLYAADGYGNACVHQFDSAGQLLGSWGTPGSQPGQFRLPHGLWVLPTGEVLVCDRENDRIQTFGPDGAYRSEWTGFHRPADLCVDAAGRIYVAELAIAEKLEGWDRWHRRLPAQVSIFDAEHNLLLRWGTEDGAAPGSFVAPHDIWVDNQGAIYVAEVTYTGGIRHGYYPAGTHALQKFARL
ncbi:MAG TPA: peptidyl-alpha-hydroxyglycine alpha-amidating lyase family protein [Chloroflexota bacterium]|nr:peptidyl-alpha-hydroxyglycine alpha-amidating lyase family protein [Chloroflexota bacterium]